VQQKDAAIATAASRTCSGATKPSPSNSASACATRISASDARGPAPSCTDGASRVARTIVNCTRVNAAPMERAMAFAMVVLPVPG
jgi:hypothetical protein